MTYINNKQSKPRTWRIKTLTTAVLVGLTMTSVSVNSAINSKRIGDLEIYKAAEQGSATIFMMLDVSSSMDTGSIKRDYGEECDDYEDDYNDESDEPRPDGSYKEDDDYQKIVAEKITAIVRNDDGSVRETVVYEPRGCIIENEYADKNSPDSKPRPRFTRLTRLKMALIELLADEVYKGKAGFKPSNKLANKGSLPDSYEIGMGYYSDAGYEGVVLVPTRALTADQRAELLVAAENLSYNSGTPTAQAIAEAGAYMMGTTTAADDNSIKVVAQRGTNYRGKKSYRNCTSNETTLSYDRLLKANVYACKNDNYGYDNNRNDNWTDWEESSSNRNTNNLEVYDTSHGYGKVYYYATGNLKYSGFHKSVPTSKKPDGLSYSSPMTADQCSGNGIYFLTDGEPYRSGDSIAKNVMNISLRGTSSSVDQCNALPETRGEAAWGCIGEYATLLRDPANNLLNRPIKTAAVGFGKTFAGLTGTREITVNDKTKIITDCESGSTSTDARNLCRLGEIQREVNGVDATLGGGGFYYTEESDDIAKSIISFAGELTQIIDTAPSGTITIPNDPYQVSNQLAYAYLPMLDPKIASSTSIWRGNLKKYKLDQGTLFGKNNKKLYKNVAGDLDANTPDLWQKNNLTQSNKIDVGGFYAQLKAPNITNINNIRTIYVEDYEDENKQKTILRKLSVINGKADGFDNNNGTDGFGRLIDTDTYTPLNQRRLLSFMGFDSVLDKDGIPTSTTSIKDLVLPAPTKEIRVLGGVVHSKPSAVSYSATLDDNGRIDSDLDTREDYVLFGSMEGALHLADTKKGEETFAIIPRQMLINQPEALVDGSEKNKIGEPYFGIDAPWLVTTDYKYDLDNKKVKVDTKSKNGMFAYGGLRMGGEAIYGMDISNTAEPKMLFAITPDGRNNDDGTERRFTRLGQIWSKPTAAKIRWEKDKDPRKVLIFGGGYDDRYEDDTYSATSNDPARGNAIYMIDAITGRLLWSTSNENGVLRNTKTDEMIHSVVGEITVLDRDNDGLVDHIYAADLGGQVFRADFENARPAKSSIPAIDNFSNKQVVRVLSASNGIDSKLAYRFYERPVVSFYRNQGGANNGKIFALVNVISGNRSAPLSTLRSNNTYANRIYGIIDSDVTRSDLYTATTLTVKNLTETNLVNLASTLGTSPNEAKKKQVQALMIGKAASGNNAAVAAKNGWYYPLTRFDGYNNVRYNKGVGDSVAINSLLYTTVYNPDKQYSSVNSCSAKISGGSERQLYCLPYGICMDETSKSGTGGFVPAGQGIQELTLGAFNKDNTNLKVLIGTTTITDRILVSNRVDYGVGSKVTNDKGVKVDSNIKGLTGVTVDSSDGSAPEYIFNERYTFQPKVWYERQQ